MVLVELRNVFKKWANRRAFEEQYWYDLKVEEEIYLNEKIEII